MRAHRLFSSAVLIAIVAAQMRMLCFSACATAAEPLRTSEDDTSEYYDRVESLEKELQKELQGRDREVWEGVYYGGTAFSSTRLTMIRGRYTMVHRRVMHAGICSKKENLIALEPDSPGVRMHWGDCRELSIVAWDKRLYLVEADRLIAFCNAVNAGKEPRDESISPFLLRDDDWEEDASGKPDVPADFEPYLLRHPVEGAIIGVGKVERNVAIVGRPRPLSGVRATIRTDGGNRLLPGMEIWASTSKDFARASVISYSGDGAEVLFDYRSDDSFIQSGLAVSTRWESPKDRDPLDDH